MKYIDATGRVHSVTAIEVPPGEPWPDRAARRPIPPAAEPRTLPVAEGPPAPEPPREEQP